VGQINNIVFVYSLALAKKIQESPSINKVIFRTGDFVILFGACLFLSIKLVVDTEKWFLVDFSTISKIGQKMLHDAELMICDDILNFDVNIQESQLSQIYQIMSIGIEKRRKRKITSE
jgi:hypothetical protein